MKKGGRQSLLCGDPPGIVLRDSADRPSYSVDDVRDRVVLGDTFEVLRKLPPESVDLVFIDPPYFLQLPKKRLLRWKVRTAVEAVSDEWDRFPSFEEYDAFCGRLLSEARRLMKPAATIWVIATYHSIFRLGKIMQDQGFWILNDVIWVKNNPMPNWLGVRFTNATETLIWASRDKDAKRHTFDKRLAKQFGVGKVGANVWNIPICTGEERLKRAGGGKLHSTQKPEELLRRVILTTTREGDLVLDPVAGTGTTGYVAWSLRRHFVMVEINPKYVAGIEERFARGRQARPGPASPIA
ncbi:MAG: site-specific DNA-methyltransferase [Euryarchaeota archaeon]|nr:site-specific DNA-methyltransferase [Euryarchaeota archaeon]